MSLILLSTVRSSVSMIFIITPFLSFRMHVPNPLYLIPMSWSRFKEFSSFVVNCCSSGIPGRSSNKEIAVHNITRNSCQQWPSSQIMPKMDVASRESGCGHKISFVVRAWLYQFPTLQPSTSYYAYVYSKDYHSKSSNFCWKKYFHSYKNNAHYLC